MIKNDFFKTMREFSGWSTPFFGTMFSDLSSAFTGTIDERKLKEVDFSRSEFLKEAFPFLNTVGEVSLPPLPVWSTHNRIFSDLDTMKVRDFSKEGINRVVGQNQTSSVIPIIIDAPYAGHSSTIADYDVGQSLVEVFLKNGHDWVLATDWKQATLEMRYFSINKYLADLLTVVEDLGGKVNLVGLCQGGWLSAIFAARYPQKVNSLVLAGSPMDTHAGNGPLKKMIKTLPSDFYKKLVEAGGGLMRGQFMLAGWKSMNPEKHYFEKYVDLYENRNDPLYLKRAKKFAEWYENPIDLPGTYYLQAIEDLFKHNKFAKGEFKALGHKVGLKDVFVPVYLLGGESDDITPPEQVLAAEQLVSTPTGKIQKKIVPGGHIGLFMGQKNLTDVWPEIVHWVNKQDGLMNVRIMQEKKC